jgi:F-type H+-transporting ATPase subunit epsilon
VQLKVITPERAVFAGEDVQQVILPAENGELGILPRHMPMVCSMTIGRIQVHLTDRTVNMATSGGFAEVLEDEVTVLADTAETSDEIDVERARSARRRAEERLRKRAEDLDMARAQAALSRAINRLRVAEAE